MEKFKKPNLEIIELIKDEIIVTSGDTKNTFGPTKKTDDDQSAW